MENRLHYIRDVSLGEDACRVRSGHVPQLFAALRHRTMGLLRQRTRHPFIPAAARRFMADPFTAWALMLPMTEGNN